MHDAECVEFLQWALPRMRMRWTGFRKVRRQVCRRIAGRLRALGVADLDAYRRLLGEEPAEWQHLDPLCRVTISRFFRDRGVFAALESKILPRLAGAARARGRPALRAWSAGCASGEEPHSLRLLWANALAPDFSDLAFEITATDIDEHLLERARRARYPAGSLREVPEAWRTEAFQEVDGLFQLKEEVGHGLELRLEDLRKTAPSGPFDLVLCRNLAFTYYADDLQRVVLGRIGSVLRSGGVLVIGGHEALPAAALGFRAIESAPGCFERTP